MRDTSKTGSDRTLGIPDGPDDGFTLVEVVMSILVASLLLLAIGYGIRQLFDMNTRNVNHMTAVQQVQSAGYWVTRDAVMAQCDNLTASGGSLSLRWVDSDDLAKLHLVSYDWDPNTKALYRTYDGKQSVVAQHIDPAPTFSYADGRLTFVVTSTVKAHNIEERETRTYEVTPRSDAS